MLRFINRKSILLLLTLFLLFCTGCGRKQVSMSDGNAQIIKDPVDITGTWVIPGNSPILKFEKDGSCEETKQKMKGTYQFFSGNASFTLSDLFHEVHYLSCMDKKNQAFFTGAVLGDLIAGYQENLRRDCYYVRAERSPVDSAEIFGSWKDVNGDEYTISLENDGSVTTTDWNGTYEIVENEQYGTSLILHFENYDEKYAIIRYEKYLFLYREGTSLVYQLEPQTETSY